jgi:hypothetical protein
MGWRRDRAKRAEVAVAQGANLGRWCHALVLMACLASSGALAQSSGFPPAENRCLYVEEESAFHIDMLRTRLLVAALACVRHDDYNRSYLRHAGTYAATYDLLRQHFQRHDGARADRAFDDWRTWMVNSYARAAMSQGAEFCPAASITFARAASAADSLALSALADEEARGMPLGLPRC